MISKTRVLLAMTAVAIGSMLSAAPAKADILYNWFGPEYVAYRPIFPRRYAVAYAPTVAYSPVASGCNTCATTVSYAPVATGCNTCASTTVGYAPYSVGYAPYTAYSSWYPRRAYYQPATSYYGGCSTCGVQTAMYAAPACGCATGGCASGNCALNYGSVSSGCSTCGIASATPAYNVTPTSSFEPTPAAASVSAPGSTYNVPQTTPEGSQSVVAPGSTYNVPRTTPEPGTSTPTPAIPQQNQIPQTQLEPAQVGPDTTGAVNGPSLFRGSATQQLSPQLRAVPHTNEEGTAPARPQLVDPQDKTARAIRSDFEVRQAVYSTPVNITPVAASPSTVQPLPKSTSLSVLNQRAKSQEEVDAEGWGPATR